MTKSGVIVIEPRFISAKGQRRRLHLFKYEFLILNGRYDRLINFTIENKKHEVLFISTVGYVVDIGSNKSDQRRHEYDE